MARLKTYFSITSRALKEIPALVAYESIPKHYISFLTTVSDLASEEGAVYIGRDVLVNRMKGLGIKGLSPATMAGREKVLLEMGVLKDSKTDYNGVAIINRSIEKVSPLFAMYPISEPAEKTPKTRNSKNAISSTFAYLEYNSIPVLYPDTTPVALFDSLFCGFLDVATRVRNADKRKVINTIYPFGRDESISIEATTRSNDTAELMLLTDFRAIRALNVMYIKYMTEKLERGMGELFPEDAVEIASGFFIFDILDLCQQMGLSRKAASAANVRSILRRLDDTTFKINAEGSKTFQSKFLDGATKATVSYLIESSEFSGQDTPLTPLDQVSGKSGKTLVTDRVTASSRIQRVRFHSSVTAGLLTKGRRHVSHSGLQSDKDPMVHRLSGWCKIIIGVRGAQNTEGKEFALDELHFRVMPTCSYDEFNDALMKTLKKNRILDPKSEFFGLSLVYGYYFSVITDAEKITEVRRKKKLPNPTDTSYNVVKIWRDVNDPIVGDNSDANLAERRKVGKSKKTPANQKDLFLDWMPSKEVAEEMIQAGYDYESIKHIANRFVSSANASEQKVKYPDKAFKGYAQKYFSTDRQGALSSASMLRLQLLGIAPNEVNRAINVIEDTVDGNVCDLAESELFKMVAGVAT